MRKRKKQKTKKNELKIFNFSIQEKEGKKDQEEK